MRLRHLLSFFTVFVTTALFAFAAEEFVKPDTPPVPVRTPPPQYPQSLKREGVAGIVTVAIIVDEKGAVTSAVINKSSNPEFEAPSLEAVKKWKFKPATKDNQAIASKVIVPLHFTVES
jgi:periplasmic protein TonB